MVVLFYMIACVSTPSEPPGHALAAQPTAGTSTASTALDPPEPSSTTGTDPVGTPSTEPATVTRTTLTGPEPYNLCGAPTGVRTGGTWSSPVVAPWFPFLDQHDTRLSGTMDALRYDCAPDTWEEGPEWVYAFWLPEDAWFRAELDEHAGVDVDLHLLQDASIDADGLVSGCLERANTSMERELSAGAYLLAVDTWSTEQGESWPGGFVLSIEAFANGVWYEVALGEGLSWRHQRRRGGPLDDQSLDVLEVDPTRWELAPIRHDGCERVPDVALDLGALGAINAAFFEFDGVCTAKDMIRRDGVTEATNQKDDPQRTMVWNDGEAPSFAWVDLGADHTEHDNAVGGWPSLVTDSAVLAEPARTDSFHTARHPRSALAVTADGTLLLATADGRTAHGDGMTIEEWAGTLRDLGAVHAINVDGGGSSTLVAAGCSLEGTVNHPSDGGGDDHSGARWVSDGVYVLER